MGIAGSEAGRSPRGENTGKRAEPGPEPRGSGLKWFVFQDGRNHICPLTEMASEAGTRASRLHACSSWSPGALQIPKGPKAWEGVHKRPSWAPRACAGWACAPFQPSTGSCQKIRTAWRAWSRAGAAQLGSCTGNNCYGIRRGARTSLCTPISPQKTGWVEKTPCLPLPSPQGPQWSLEALPPPRGP